MSTHGPVDQEYKAKMLAVASTIDEFFNEDLNDRTTGFALIVFPFDDNKVAKGEGRINYMSNAKRQDMIRSLEELLARWKGTHPEEQADGD